jgi:hypothetical protein
VREGQDARKAKHPLSVDVFELPVFDQPGAGIYTRRHRTSTHEQAKFLHAGILGAADGL